MKIRIIEDPDMEDEIVIHCRHVTPEIQKFVDQSTSRTILGLHRGSEVSLNLDEVLFFETEGDGVYVHLAKNSYLTKYRLYELEEALGESYMRISKSTIINCDKVSSLERNLTSSRSVQFFETNKLVYVSRMYYSLLKNKIKERNIL